jgi:hypothetical protein
MKSWGWRQTVTVGHQGSPHLLTRRLHGAVTAHVMGYPHGCRTDRDHSAPHRATKHSRPAPRRAPPAVENVRCFTHAGLQTDSPCNRIEPLAGADAGLRPAPAQDDCTSATSSSARSWFRPTPKRRQARRRFQARPPRLAKPHDMRGFLRVPRPPSAPDPTGRAIASEPAGRPVLYVLLSINRSRLAATGARPRWVFRASRTSASSR